jgi:hypothetical protein
MPMMENTTRLKTWVGNYSFAVDGGGTGAKTLRSEDGPIPTGSVVTGGYLDVTTAFTTAASGEAAVAVEGAGDLIAATVVSGAPYSTTGRKDVIVDATGSTAIKTTAARSPTLTISVGAITAGVAKLVLFYV